MNIYVWGVYIGGIKQRKSHYSCEKVIGLEGRGLLRKFF